MNSASLCSLAGRYDNPIPPRFLAPIDCLKIPALEKLRCFCTFHFRRRQIYVKSILTVETELNGDSRVQMKGVLPWLVPWALCAGTRDVYPALAALVSPVQNMFFLAVHYLNLCVPIAQQHGQAVVKGDLSLETISSF